MSFATSIVSLEQCARLAGSKGTSDGMSEFCAECGEKLPVAKPDDLLAPIYGWFTEGFDTPDLNEAKALLDDPRG